MHDIDLLAVAATMLAEFGGTVLNPLLVVALAGLAFASVVRPRVLRLVGCAAGVALGGLTAAGAANAFEAGAALTGGLAGGLVVAEMVQSVVVPVLRAAGIVVATAVEVAGVFARRLAMLRNGRRRAGSRTDDAV